MIIVFHRQFQLIFRRNLSSIAIKLSRNYGTDGKRESYFGAIGGETEDPPPDLTPQQVTNILRTNEITLSSTVKPVKSIQCNQLASNHPIEDRLRIAKFNFKSLSPSLASSNSSDSIAYAVFDGHGGGSCADIISRRLFHYIALSLLPKTTDFNIDTIEQFVQDLYICPKPNTVIRNMYDDGAVQFITKYLNDSEQKALLKYANELNDSHDISEKIFNAFLRCDSDLSDEIEKNLLSSPSNILLHYYLSLAVSGCCVSLMLIHQDMAYIASCGDCRAVLGLNNMQNDNQRNIKAIELSREHNTDNITELKRVLSEHPKSEQNNVIRNNRLLGQLMPLRAFGDFNYKWSIEKVQKLGLTRAFGSHVIPPYYLTPPYLISTPEVQQISIKDINNKFIVIATDGLWELFESSRKVVKSVYRHKNRNTDAQNEPIVDDNCATHLIRTALGSTPSIDSHADPNHLQHQQHARLVTYLTLPQSVVRNFRDDISLIVLNLES